MGTHICIYIYIYKLIHQMSFWLLFSLVVIGDDELAKYHRLCSCIEQHSARYSIKIWGTRGGAAELDRRGIYSF